MFRQDVVFPVPPLWCAKEMTGIVPPDQNILPAGLIHFVPICSSATTADRILREMEDLTVYMIIGVLMFFIGLILGYLLMSRYYVKRFVKVGIACSKAENISPLITELERES